MAKDGWVIVNTYDKEIGGPIGVISVVLDGEIVQTTAHERDAWVLPSKSEAERAAFDVIAKDTRYLGSLTVKPLREIFPLRS